MKPRGLRVGDATAMPDCQQGIGQILCRALVLDVLGPQAT